MSQSPFNASDWVYVADPMGRLGQGYYENKYKKSEKLTVAAFVSRRKISSQPITEDKEQISNKITQPQPSIRAGSPYLAGGTSELTPWENPVFGEQRTTSKDEEVKAAEKEIEVSTTTTPVQPQKPQKVEHVAENGQHDRASLENAHEQEGGNERKVICSELVRQGLMSQRAHQVCSIYADRHLTPSFTKGYHFWAVPYVRWMRRSRTATWAMAFLVRHRTGEVAFQLGLTTGRTVLGRLLCRCHDSFCSLIGHYVRETDYRSLYKTA